MKVNGQYYRDVLLSKQMLPAIKHVAGDMFVLQQDNAPSHRVKHTIKLLQQEMLDFIGPDLWPPNSQDMNLADYKVWGVKQQRVYECRVNCRWAEAAPRWGLEQSATERYWHGHQQVEKAFESVRACRWTTFWTFIVSACDWQKLWTNKISVTFFNLKNDAPLLLRLWFSWS